MEKAPSPVPNPSGDEKSSIHALIHDSEIPDNDSDGEFTKTPSKTRSISSSFSDLGDFDSLEDSYGTVNTPFSPIEEERRSREKLEAKDSGSWIHREELDENPIRVRPKCVLNSLPTTVKGEVLQMQVEHTSYVIFSAPIKDEVLNGEISGSDLKTPVLDFNAEPQPDSLITPVRASNLDNCESDTAGPGTYEKTRSLGRGLFRASAYVGSGFLKGASGLVSQTYEGGSNGGLFGLAKGLGVGMIGLGTSTVKGAFRGVGQVTNVVGEMVLGSQPYKKVSGTILLTNYRIIWISSLNGSEPFSTEQPMDSKNVIEIPLGHIHSVENGISAPHILEIDCKHVLNVKFCFEDEDLCIDFLQAIQAFYLDFQTSYTYSFIETACKPWRDKKGTEDGADDGIVSDCSEDDWCKVTSPSQVLNLDPIEDYSRLKLLPSTTDIKIMNFPYQLYNNSSYEDFPSYPSLFVIPFELSTLEVQDIGAFRSSKRIPAVVWKHPRTEGTISRCSQPRVGLSGASCEADQKLVRLLQQQHIKVKEKDQDEELSSDCSAQLAKFHFIDCRSQIAAAANLAQGKGTEDIRNYPISELHYCDIPNIHAVRSFYGYLKIVCQPLNQQLPVSELQQQFLTTGWGQLLQQILCSVKLCVQYIESGEHVMVHCSDGWDRTPQVTALTQLLLDPWYRTLPGFLMLLQKEWISFGHQFRSRCAQGECPNHIPHEEEISPVFIQFLDCVYQLLVKNPRAFEFNEGMLRFLYYHTYSCLFTTFLYNNEKERAIRNPSHRKQELNELNGSAASAPCGHHIARVEKTEIFQFIYYEFCEKGRFGNPDWIRGNEDLDKSNELLDLEWIGPGNGEDFEQLKEVDGELSGSNILLWKAHLDFADPLNKDILKF